MIIKVCDLCKKNSPDAKIKYRYQAKDFGDLGMRADGKEYNYARNVLTR